MVSLTTTSPNALPGWPGESGLRRLAANLAHNVNNTLTGVIGYLELALRETAPGTTLRDHLQRSLTCSLRIAEMVRRIVAYAYHPPGHGDWTLVSLRRVAEYLDPSVGEPLPVPGLTVTVRAEADGLIRASGPLLLLVLDQLVSNALEAMPQGGTLSLRVWEEGSRRCLSVTDTGSGMSAGVQAHLFEPFFSTKYSGHLGLGLALSQDVTVALGGTITVASVEGQGTTVTLSFPAAEQARADELPIDERIGLLLPDRLSRYPGPHFSRPPLGAEPGRSETSCAI